MPGTRARRAGRTLSRGDRVGAVRGLSRVKAQQLVYRAMGAWMGQEIHALSMQTFTPEEWGRQSA